MTWLLALKKRFVEIDLHKHNTQIHILNATPLSPPPVMLLLLMMMMITGPIFTLGSNTIARSLFSKVLDTKQNRKE
jgi:hypothetical protein